MGQHTIWFLIIALIGVLYGLFVTKGYNKDLGVVKRVKNLKPKPNENECLNIILVDLDGVIAELAFTDKQIMNASIKMSRNSEDSRL